MSVFGVLLPLVFSSVVLSLLVSSCLGFSALVSSAVVCSVSPGSFWASLGTQFGPPTDLSGAPGALGSLLAGPGGPWAAPWGHSWRLLGLSWPAPAPEPALKGSPKETLLHPQKTKQKPHNFGFLSPNRGKGNRVLAEASHPPSAPAIAVTTPKCTTRTGHYPPRQPLPGFEDATTLPTKNCHTAL